MHLTQAYSARTPRELVAVQVQLAGFLLGGELRGVGRQQTRDSYDVLAISRSHVGERDPEPGKAEDIQSLVAAAGMVVKSGMPNT